VGKSTIRRRLELEFTDVLETAELGMLGETPEWNLAWRQRMVERLVQRALVVQRRGKHFLFCGDPVPPGEVWAAPSADQLGSLAVCLLDASVEAQTARLLARGDDPSLIPQHVAFADWMRRHVVDHNHRPEVITRDGWPPMRWDRWVGTTSKAPPWSGCIIDTTALDPGETAQRVAQWLRRETMGRI
jgi:hypothetical protein